MNKFIIAIDGPAGAGKSTVARIVAQQLGYTYIDTGAMYRAVTWATIQSQININDEDRVTDIAENLKLKLEYSSSGVRVKVDENDITEAIRSPEVSRQVALVAQISGVRKAMVQLQRQLACCGGVVLDGRDIGTYVLPNADIKVFLTASVEERAKRRWLEMVAKGYKVELADLAEEIAMRDKQDRERDISPLVIAEDAVLIDTTDMSINDAVKEIIRLGGGENNGL